MNSLRTVIAPEELARQRQYAQGIRAMFESREAHPLACVDTFGCQQNVADGEKLMGMLGEKFPGAQFRITGVLGPHSNAHGPNEFLHIFAIRII